MKTAKIITIPHPALRATNKKITVFDKKLTNLLQEMEQALAASNGVGLAAPQIEVNYQLFTTNLNQVLQPKTPLKKPWRHFINPKIIDHSPKKTFSKEPDGGYTLEGCLSLPGLYSPIPRYQWVEIEFLEPNSTTQTLEAKREKFSDFYARNVQHEIDHLNGILFTDHALEEDLIIYRGQSRNDKLTEVDDVTFLTKV